MTPKSQAKIKPQFPHIWFSGGYTQILFQFQCSKLMFWNVFFEGAIYGCWLGGCTQILFQFQYSKLMFWNVFSEDAIYSKFMVAD